MIKKQMGPSPLAEAERAVLEAGRERMRQRLERDLQKQADEVGDFPPSSHQRLMSRRRSRILLQTSVGRVEVETSYGKGPVSGAWINPMRAGRWLTGRAGKLGRTRAASVAAWRRTTSSQ